MSWGIAETAQEIEKIKAESADYLNGLNSCGIIDYSVYSTAFDYYTELIDEAYSLGKSESKQQWIPCSEKMPKKGRYLVTGKKNRDWYESDTIVTVAFYDGEFWTDNGDIQAEAWMPLPEPYKGEEE